MKIGIDTMGGDFAPDAMLQALGNLLKTPWRT